MQSYAIPVPASYGSLQHNRRALAISHGWQAITPISVDNVPQSLLLQVRRQNQEGSQHQTMTVIFLAEFF